ncbi:hypothetical protein Sjap_001648 [Stephania japonica]|uniref:Uncharacterized protein n=1 Tax=Stephania japonica TaxID=461633 RepID=A0AAP0KKB1_9MAGN
MMQRSRRGGEFELPTFHPASDPGKTRMLRGRPLFSGKRFHLLLAMGLVAILSSILLWCFFTPAKLSSEDKTIASAATTPNEIQLVEANKLKSHLKYDGHLESFKRDKDFTSLKQIMDDPYSIAILSALSKLLYQRKNQY